MVDESLMVKRSERDRRRLPPAHFAEHPGLATLVDENDHKHGEAHQRLRADFRELEERLNNALGLLRDDVVTTRNKVTEVASTPVDVTKLVLTPKIVASIVFVVVGIVASVWGSTYGLSSDVDKILARMDSEERVMDERAKLIDLNNATIKQTLEVTSKEMKESIASITRRQELQQMQIAELKESILILTQGRK